MSASRGIRVWSLLAGLAFLFLSTGDRIVPIAAWLSPLFLLRFVRGPRAGLRLLVAWILDYLVQCVAWKGVVPVPGGAYYGIIAGLSLVSFLPFIVDRLVAPRFAGGFASTLIFPCAWAGFEFLNSCFSPYGSWGSLAYAWVDDLPLLQLVSVTGLWGLSFLVAWGAAVVCWAWESGFEWRLIRSGALTYSIILALVASIGGIRLAYAPADGPSTRIASFTVRNSDLDVGDLLSRRRSGALLDDLRSRLAAKEDTFFAWSRREAQAGARIVFCSEVNLYVLKSEEARVLDRCAAFARQEGAHLMVAMAVFEPGAGFYENEIAFFDPSGHRLARYHKAKPVPGDPEQGADREIPVFETALGRVAGAICFDMDFPSLIRRAGREGASLILAPSSDWRAIDPVHTRMALVRGVENGCPVVRQTHQGLSATADAYGRLIAQADFFQTNPHVMVSQVPLVHVSTLYSKVGDLFAYLCLAGLVALIAAAIRPGH